MYEEDDSISFEDHLEGPKKLVDELLRSGYQLEPSDEKGLLGSKSKFGNALSTLQEDFRPSKMVSCREKQKQDIYDYLKYSLQTQGCSQSLYISGVPGIGKTLCVKEVMARFEQQNKDKIHGIYTNGLNLKRPLQIFRSIYYGIFGSGVNIDPLTAMYKLNQLFQKGIDIDPQPSNNIYSKELRMQSRFQTKKEQQSFIKKKKILILDELDFLKTTDEDVLYNIFDWTQKKKSHLIIISISNTLDFPEQLSPKVNSRIGNKRLTFKPYESGQIQLILNERIKHLDVFDQYAVKYICKKIAQCSSDIRKCLFVLRQSILDFVMEEKKPRKNSKYEDIKHKKIGIQTLTKIQDRVYMDHFATFFKDFPPCYKIILYFLAKHFKSDTIPCTLRKLEHMCQPWSKTRNQLLSTLCDLKELGIVKIKYSRISKERKNYSGFIDMKQLSEEHISLVDGYERIIYALQKQDLNELSKGSFRMDLNF